MAHGGRMGGADVSERKRHGGRRANRGTPGLSRARVRRLLRALKAVAKMGERNRLAMAEFVSRVRPVVLSADMASERVAP